MKRNRDVIQLPLVSKLPLPPLRQDSWPWQWNIDGTENLLNETSHWPRVSIITPSYNQATYLEQTIRSVLLQGYPNLEYIVIDGGSNDGSVEIIRKYERWLAFWVSEPDSGQSDALNKGFQRATGSIVGWLNSDDILRPNVLRARTQALLKSPDAVLVYGDCRFVDESGAHLKTWAARPCSAQSLLMEGNQIPQPSVLMRRAALESAGWIEQRYQYIMDYELWMRLSKLGELNYIPGIVADFRQHDVSKSAAYGGHFVEETIDWLLNWEGLEDILLPVEQAELFRRLHLQAALEYLISGQAQPAIGHLRISLADSVFPFGDIDNLASYISEYSARGGGSLYDSWANITSLEDVLAEVLPTPKANSLWRRIAARYHMHHMFTAYHDAGYGCVRHHWPMGIRYDWRWLWNLGVISIGLRSLLRIPPGSGSQS